MSWPSIQILSKLKVGHGVKKTIENPWLCDQNIKTTEQFSLRPAIYLHNVSKKI